MGYINLWCIKYLGYSENKLSEIILDPGSWSLDNFGEKLIATIHNGKTFIWDPSLASPLDQTGS